MISETALGVIPNGWPRYTRMRRCLSFMAVQRCPASSRSDADLKVWVRITVSIFFCLYCFIRFKFLTTNFYVTQLALRLLMLTGLRSHPIRHAHLDEIDDDIWTIPGEKMKGLKGKTPSFRVPLAPEALHVIELASQQQQEGYTFPGIKREVIMCSHAGCV